MNEVNKASVPLRSTVREVMKLVPDRWWSLTGLHAQIRTLIPSAAVLDVNDALTWNYGQGNVKREFNHEVDCDTWQLTERGLTA